MNEQIEFLNQVNNSEFKKLLRNLNDFESRAKVNEILSACLENKIYLISKKAFELIYLWFEHSFYKVILTPNFVPNEEIQSEIFEYFYDQLKPHRQKFNPKKGSSLVFLTQLLKNAINTYLRKIYRKPKVFRFSDLIDNEGNEFDLEKLGEESNFGFAVNKDISFLVYNKFLKFLKQKNINYIHRSFYDFYVDFNKFINNLNKKLDYDCIFEFLKNYFSVDKKIKKSFKSFLKNKDNTKRQ